MVLHVLNFIRAIVITQMSNVYLCVNCNAYGMYCINPGWAGSGFTFLSRFGSIRGILYVGESQVTLFTL